MSGFTRANTIQRRRAQLPLDLSRGVGCTLPGTVWYQVVAGREKRVLIDPAGEFFNRLNPGLRAEFGLDEIMAADLEFLRESIARLAGIVLVFDLTHENPKSIDAPWRAQEEDLHFLLSAIR